MSEKEFNEEQEKCTAEDCCCDDPEKAQQEYADAVDESDPSEAEAATDELTKWRELAMRTAAEYDNYRKRTLKEKEQSYGNGKADAVAKILPIYDNLERAMNQACTDEAYKKGVEMTLTQLVTILNGMGVEIFGQVGDTFDPNLHNAVMHEDNEEFGENIVSEEFIKGYTYRDSVVRHSMVKVAN